MVIIWPEAEDVEIKTSEEARDAVFTLVNPRKKEIQVRAVRKINGNGLMVETTKPEDLKVFTENEKLGHDGEGDTGLYHEAEPGQAERRRRGRNEILLQDEVQAQRGNQLDN